jgi:hypothetical protein
MSLQSSVNLVIERGPSRRLLLLYAVFFGSAALGIAITDISAVLKGVVLATLAAGAVTVFRCHILLLNPDSVVELGYSAGRWIIHTRDGSSRQAQLLSAAFWIFDIMPLVFAAADNKRFTILLTPDRVQPEPLRELRAWIRHRLPAA